jgi:hypothetical protein
MVEARELSDEDFSTQWGADQQKAAARGLEPRRAEPNGCLVHHNSHSVTLSLESIRHAPWTRWIRPERITTFAMERLRDRWCSLGCQM